MTGWKHRREGLTIWQRGAVLTAVAAFVVIAVGSWRDVAPGSQPAPTTTTNPADGFHAPPRMTLGTRSTKGGPS